MSQKPIRTMDEFAQASGVSRPTLSKYFDDPQSVRAATRRRIEAALETSGYRPNLFARNLNRRQTRHVGVIVPHLTDPFYAELVRRIELRCLDAGFWPIVIASHGSPDLEARAVDTLIALKVAGALMAPLGAASDAALLSRLGIDIPLVLLDAPLEGRAPFVGTDNRQSLALITEYLCRTGAHPAFVEMPEVNRNAAERRAAYIETVQRFGLEPILIGGGGAPSWDFEALGIAEVARLLDGPGLPTKALLCANDRIAFGAMAAAFERGLTIGRGDGCDLRIAGHDDHPLSRYTCPPLTTVAQDVAALAERSTEMLFEALQNGDAPAKDLRLPARLVMRDSA
ncbi:LacI family DNA-binding transcriptional regulator [Jiella sp. M17.18]|uniref:LacI family DNA-binding transcriptional regulator n=1 Tax=Jiella sp. M17.18 TaxID=3234247 RepID=UPI0034DF16B8